MDKGGTATPLLSITQPAFTLGEIEETRKAVRLTMRRAAEIVRTVRADLKLPASR